MLHTHSTRPVDYIAKYDVILSAALKLPTGSNTMIIKW